MSDALAYLFQGLAQGAQPMIQMLPYLMQQKKQEEERKKEREEARADRQEDRSYRRSRDESEDAFRAKQLDYMIKRGDKEDVRADSAEGRAVSAEERARLDDDRRGQMFEFQLGSAKAQYDALPDALKRQALLEGLQVETGQEGLAMSKAQRKEWDTNAPARTRASEIDIQLKELGLKAAKQADLDAPGDQAYKRAVQMSSLMDSIIGAENEQNAPVREFLMKSVGQAIELSSQLPQLATQLGGNVDAAQKIVDRSLENLGVSLAGYANLLGITAEDLEGDNPLANPKVKKFQQLKHKMLSAAVGAVMTGDENMLQELNVSRDAILRSLASEEPAAEEKPKPKKTGKALGGLFTPKTVEQSAPEKAAASRSGYTGNWDDRWADPKFKKEAEASGIKPQATIQTPIGMLKLFDNNWLPKNAKIDADVGGAFDIWAQANPIEARDALVNYSRSRGVGVDEQVVSDFKLGVVRRMDTSGLNWREDEIRATRSAVKDLEMGHAPENDTKSFDYRQPVAAPLAGKG